MCFQITWQTYPERYETFKTMDFAELVNEWKPLTIFAKSSILEA